MAVKNAENMKGDPHRRKGKSKRMSDAAGTIESILSEHKGNLTLPDYWEIGRAVRGHLQAHKYRGDATLAKLSKAAGVSARMGERFRSHARIRIVTARPHPT